IRFKAPKSKAGRRDITLPEILVDALREHRKAQLELRMKLGMGRLPSDAPAVRRPGGRPTLPQRYQRRLGDYAASLGIPDVTFHALRHTHASQLIDAGVDIVTISKTPGARQPGHHLAHLCPSVPQMTARLQPPSTPSWGTENLCPNLCPRHVLFL